MIGLIHLIVMGGHFLLSIWVVNLAVKKARKRSKPGWHYGVPAGIAMFLVLYWDLIPTHAVHRYHCLVDGGFAVNKTLDEWKLENPGVAETLVPISEPYSEIEGNRKRYRLNQRFAWDINTSHHAFGVREKDEHIVDLENGDVLARYVDFDTDIRRLTMEPRNFRDLRLWLAVTSCEMDVKSRISFADFQKEIEQIGR
ncbi:MAG: hypothetical protein N0E58_07160 [Candidatus Thiodiazotropha endolucinida]|uniref:Uncharacterized protein n=1 Tax=Candidatus Thiodiazotropha taylori TaxID=2792791 RepID=A0A9E4NJ48_9GAMM|nr:hypothetical protein [Candidatus Thiodiazotropha taylori]MCW4236029.1 hypothetical protein [Candidatus Thiodiazotropha endolucinida]